MPEDFFTNTEQIKKTIERFLQSQTTFSQMSSFGSELTEKLQAFVPKGKLLRSNLCIKTAEHFGLSDTNSLLPIAAALEFCHSSLLIHDDIIDEDELRRGGPSIPEQYRQNYPNQPKLLSQSLAICAGDIGFFFAFELMIQAEIDPLIKNKLSAFIAKEMALVGQAEMIDSEFGYRNEHPEIEEVITAYTYKTARYTFSLPMMVGAIAAEATEAEIKQVEEIGICLGILFQIKDDEIGLLGDAQTIGKPVGSDISSNKKTLFSYYLFSKATEDDKKKLHSIFGKSVLTEGDIEFVRSCLIKNDVLSTVHNLAHDYAEQARTKIDALQQPKLKELLLWFVDYNLSRNY